MKDTASAMYIMLRPASRWKRRIEKMAAYTGKLRRTTVTPKPTKTRTKFRNCSSLAPRYIARKKSSMAMMNNPKAMI